MSQPSFRKQYLSCQCRDSSVCVLTITLLRCTLESGGNNSCAEDWEMVPPLVLQQGFPGEGAQRWQPLLPFGRRTPAQRFKALALVHSEPCVPSSICFPFFGLFFFSQSHGKQTNDKDAVSHLWLLISGLRTIVQLPSGLSAFPYSLLLIPPPLVQAPGHTAEPGGKQDRWCAHSPTSQGREGESASLHQLLRKHPMFQWPTAATETTPK